MQRVKDGPLYTVMQEVQSRCHLTLRSESKVQPSKLPKKETIKFGGRKIERRVFDLRTHL